MNVVKFTTKTFISVDKRYSVMKKLLSHGSLGILTNTLFKIYKINFYAKNFEVLYLNNYAFSTQGFYIIFAELFKFYLPI